MTQEGRARSLRQSIISSNDSEHSDSRGTIGHTQGGFQSQRTQEG